MSLRTIPLFISHSWNYSNHYDTIIQMLKDRSYFNFTDVSVPKNNPIHTSGSETELAIAIESWVKKANIVIIPAGVYASYSKWINKEIAMAKKHSIPILGVKPWGQERLSVEVSGNAKKMVGWNTESIIAGIRELV